MHVICMDEQLGVLGVLIIFRYLILINNFKYLVLKYSDFEYLIFKYFDFFYLIFKYLT